MRKKYVSAMALSLLATASAAAAEIDRPNVLFIMVDDLRPELGCYDAPYIKTPNIDKLASRGTVFRNAYCNIPVSGASRASLLTGQFPKYPSRFVSFDSYASKDAPDAVPISAWFKENGYTTISNGKIFHHVTDHDDSWSEYPWRRSLESYGNDWAVYNKWELWLNEKSGDHINPETMRGPFFEAAEVEDEAYEDGLLAQHSIQDLKRLKTAGNPFFLAVGFWRPHLPFNSPKKYWDMYDRDQIPLATNRFVPFNLPKQVTGSSEIKSYALSANTDSDDFHPLARHGYFAAVSFIDAQIGKVLDSLDELGLRDNTIVVLVGDHGWHLGEHTFWGKHNLMNNATKAPMIIMAPGHKPAVSYSMAEFVDIYPTLCDLTGINHPVSQLDGKSLKPVLKDPKQEVKDHVRVIWGNGLNVIDKKYSYSLWGNPAEPKAEMLYNHSSDRAENENVAAENPKITAKYRDIIMKSEK